MAQYNPYVPNSKNNVNKKQKNCYFSNNINRIGENFLDFKNSRDIYFDAPNIFRQLSSGKIDLEKYGHFFFDIPFLTACIETAHQKALYHQISYNGVYFMACNMQVVTEDYSNVLDTHRRAYLAYSLVFNYLSWMKATGNINYLYQLKDQLSSKVFTNAII